MSLSTIERILLLKRAELFNQIPGEDLAAVARIAYEVYYAAGERFIQQGDPGDSLYIVVDGEAGIVIPGVGQVAVRRAGNSIGEMAAVSRQPRSADCLALTDLTLLRIDRADFWEMLTGQPALALGMISVLVDRLDEAVANLQRLGHAERTL